jgi:hypothetical protein
MATRLVGSSTRRTPALLAALLAATLAGACTNDYDKFRFVDHTAHAPRDAAPPPTALHDAGADARDAQ